MQLIAETALDAGLAETARRALAGCDELRSTTLDRERALTTYQIRYSLLFDQDPALAHQIRTTLASIEASAVSDVVIHATWSAQADRDAMLFTDAAARVLFGVLLVPKN
jgi:hypothetical protein